MNVSYAKVIARDLMGKHGLECMDWTLKMDTAKRRLGVCRHGKKEIGLSVPYIELNTVETVTNTILHEIAHALVGSGHGHDAFWRRKAIEIGCNGERCCSNDVISPKGKWVAVCGGCQDEKYRHQKPRGRSQACRECCMTKNGGRYTDDYKLDFKQKN